ncbi:MAG: insulinase family protein [Dehalococcoidia bacterium]|nr:insulinase family protein [Dehalococcoidia bacterium]
MNPLLTLDNGLRLVVTPVPHARSVAIALYVGAGARYEQPQDAGISHFVEHLCFKGTERRPRAQDISAEIDELGGSINAATDRDLTVYYAKVTPNHAADALDVLADMLRHSLFRDHEIELERDVILEELAAVEDSPSEQSNLLLDTLLWPGQPQGRDIAGSVQTVSAISPDRLREYYRHQYVANATVVAVAGAIDELAAMRLVQATLGDWQPGEPTPWLAVTDLPLGERVQAIGKETEQAHLSVGMRGLAIDHEDRYALDMLSTVLGEGMSSRLFTRLREELGLCYDIHSYPTYLRDAGAFGIYAGVDPAHAREAVCEIAKELERLQHPVEARELERAQRLVRARLVLRMEDTGSVASWYGSRAMLGIPLLTPEDTIARTDAVTAADIQRVARRLISDRQLHYAVVGPLQPGPLFAGVSVEGR